MYDVTIIGCGVIGAAAAYELARYNLKVLILEKENDVAMGTTKANSAIVHAGYDPEPGTLMAKLNVRGSAMMEELCKKLSVEYKRTGSFVLAFDDADMEKVHKLYENGVKNGVPGVKVLNRDEVLQMEPSLSEDVKGALFAPSAAIVDPWGLAIALAETAVKNGAELRRACPVTAIHKEENFLRVTAGGEEFLSRYVVNCAGVYADEISRMAGQGGFTMLPNRGEYYLLDKQSGNLVSRVIFQCPTAAGKGVLVAPTVHGNLIVGPNAVDVQDPADVSTTGEGLREVGQAAKKSVPGVDLRQSIRNFAGVRAQTDQSDFIIGPSEKNPYLLNIAGIKSPGLSAAPAIGEYAVELLGEMGLALTKKESFIDTREKVHFRAMTAEEKAELVRKNPLYGRVICRCETITEGEIVDAIHSPIPPCSLDGVKRRAGSGMGRCQGGFCGPRVQEILARELGVTQEEILQDGAGTVIITGRTKGVKA